MESWATGAQTLTCSPLRVPVRVKSQAEDWSRWDWHVCPCQKILLSPATKPSRTTLTRRAAVLSSRTSSWFARCCRLLPLATFWSSCSGHLVPFPFSLLSSGPSPLPAALLSVSLPWEALMGYRASCRLRAGTLDLAHCKRQKVTGQGSLLHLLQ